MRYGLVTVLVFLLTGSIKPVLAQQYIFKNYTVNDGLVANSVRRIFQDSKGFLWIGTWEGVSKYDGHKFSNYSTNNGLSHDFINDFYESSDGKLYVITNDGSIEMITENKIIPKAIPSTAIVNRFLPAGPDRTIVTTDKDGLKEFSNGRLTKPQQPFPSYSYTNLIWLNDSLFLTVGDSVLQVFNKKYELFAETRESYARFAECKVYMDKQKRIWLCAYKGLKRLLIPDQKNQPITYAELPIHFNIPAVTQNAVLDILEDDRGTMWIGTTMGLVKINPDGSSQVITSSQGLISDIVSCIFQDKEKNIWLGTSLGVSKLVTQTNTRIYGVDNGLWSNNIYFAYPFKKGYVLAGTYKGVQVYNTTSGKFIPIANSINRNITDVVPNSTPLLLFGSDKLISLDTAGLACTKNNSYYFGGQYFYSAISNQKGNFFLGDNFHLYFFSGNKDPAVSLLDHRPTSMVIDRNGSLWAGTWENGLYRFRYTVIDNKIKITGRDQYLSTESIRSLFEDSKGNIWVGTRYHGVYVYRNGDTPALLHKFDQSKGLTSNFIKWIKEDRKGNIWVVFYRGLDKLIKLDTVYRVFNFSEVNNYFGTIVTMEIDEENSLWLATNEGLVQITDGEMEKSSPLPVYITKISSPDSVYPANVSGLNLGYRHNQLQFEFSSPGFLNEKQNLYSYRLSGSSNPEWTKPVNEHSVSYANLQPGTYRFEVRNKGWNGEWGVITSFDFAILPPFWKTWWFISVMLLFAALLIYILIKRRVSQVRKEGELKQKITEMEMAALRAQMNPHFIFNCLNAIDNLVQTNQKEKATTYLVRFAKLIRSVLDSSKNNLVPFQNDYESLQLYLQMEQFRCNNKFSYELNADKELLYSDFKLPPLIVQPFVENAIHHGLLNKQTSDRKLCVLATLEDDFIKYTVTDNGVGRKRAQEIKEINKPGYQSYGVAITAERIHLYNQNKKSNDIIITDLSENGHPAGTKVEICLKIGDNK